MKKIKKAAQLLGQKGGIKTKQKYGKEYFQKIGKKGGSKKTKRNGKGQFC